MMARRILLPLALAGASPGLASAQSPFGFEDALRVGDAAVTAARAAKSPIAVVVVNREGRVLVALRMDGISYLNLEVAQAKAVTAAALGAPTSAIEQAVDGGKPSFLSVPGLSAIGGGVPIMRSGHAVAGIGVSGGSPEQDTAVAQAALTNQAK